MESGIMGTLAIDPSTGERISSGSEQIDPATGERIAAAAPATPAPETGIHSFLSALGIPTSRAELDQQQPTNPVLSALSALGYGPAVQAGEGVYNQGKQSVMQAIQAYHAMRSGNPAQAAVNAVTAIPVVGPALNKAADQSPALTGSYAHQVGQVATSPAMGTLLGTSAAVAPIVAGGIDAALPGRPLVGAIPTKSAAGDIFNSLNTDLENHPVKLNAALEPLQRAVEIGGRGSTLPKAVSDLLTRSESPIGTEMTFPEARDYQGALSDLSASDKLAMNGRMRGAVSQLQKGLFNDIYDSANIVGRGEDYANAMKQYRQAAQLNQAAKTVGKYAVRAGLGAGGLGAAYGIVKEATK
jgi:hypothetical protein